MSDEKPPTATEKQVQVVEKQVIKIEAEIIDSMPEQPAPPPTSREAKAAEDLTDQEPPEKP